MSELKHFDPEALAEVVQLEEHGEGGLLASLTNDFEANFGRALEAMKKSIAVQDYKTLEREAHSLKSSSNLLGLRLLGALCAEVEQAAHEHQFDVSKQAEIANEYQTAFPALSKFTKNLKSA